MAGNRRRGEQAQSENGLIACDLMYCSEIWKFCLTRQVFNLEMKKICMFVDTEGVPGHPCWAVLQNVRMSRRRSEKTPEAVSCEG
eukprot:758994-Hanusia_phi.AAC.2